MEESTDLIADAYNTNKLKEQLKEISENTKEKIKQDKLEKSKQIRNEKYRQYSIERQRRWKKIIKYNPSKVVFDSVVNEIENSDAAKTSILEHITETGNKTIILMNSGWNFGRDNYIDTLDKLNYKHPELFSTYDVIWDFVSGPNKYYKEIEFGLFKGWIVRSKHPWYGRICSVFYIEMYQVPFWGRLLDKMLNYINLF